MYLLIDTHILIWYFDGNDKLPEKVKNQLDNKQSSVFVSIVSIWEIAIKVGLGKLKITKSLTEIEAYLVERHFKLLKVEFIHLNTLLTLPLHHNDPFDRLLIAQAITENLTLVSADQHFQAYAVNLFQ